MTLLIMTADDEDLECFNMDWVETEIEIGLDSGCCDHVRGFLDATGCSAFLAESLGSKRQHKFIAGNGERVPNEGQLLSSMGSATTNGAMKLQSCFQIADVTRPLMSVSRVCDQGLTCTFNETEAFVSETIWKDFGDFPSVGWVVYIEDAVEAT